MKYNTEIDINLPLDKVVTLFDNPDHLKKWQPTLLSFSMISGELGQPGSKVKLVYKRGKKGRLTMIETLIKHDLPEELLATYEAPGVLNHQKNTFIDLGNGKTRWQSVTEFKFSGTMKVVAFLLGKKGFQKETMKFHQLFKDFAESNPE
ncbi:SRPBCC family protein [Microscilla marina]|uniref:SRPBCC family protein n=1 Tax=Microscilla marina ATCC 23134 TaxID=313606 RepID=A1ZKY7_MICM2|nr:SRPBCC family protein [Microscilla marina]EAY28953.1 hypothetical protein M23134_00107 [Microscilla marina ATCC 23134]